MIDEILKNLLIDDRIESYEPLFKGEWAENLYEIAKPAPKLFELVVDLALSFKGVSTTAAIPLLSVNVAESYYIGHGIGRLENCQTLRLVNHIAARLEQKFVWSGQDSMELRKTMLDLGRQEK